MPSPAYTAGSALRCWGFPALTGLSRGHTIVPGGRRGAAITPSWLTEERGDLRHIPTLENPGAQREKEQTPHWSLVLETPSHSSHCSPGRVSCAA